MNTWDKWDKPEFDGPSDDDQRAANRRLNQNRMRERDEGTTGSSMQSNDRKYVGTPRNAKHGHGFVGGKRIT